MGLSVTPANLSTVAGIAKTRRQDLGRLNLASRKLDATQEALEREVNRLRNRKNAVPEARDALRLIELAQATETAMQDMLRVCNDLSTSWATL